MEEDIKSPKKKKEINERMTFLMYIKFITLVVIVIAGITAYRMLENHSGLLRISQAAEKKSFTLAAARYIKSLTKINPSDVEKLASSTTVEKGTSQVLGAVTTFADNSVTQVSDVAIDYVYDHTIEQVIRTMIERLPERQKKHFYQQLCEEKSGSNAASLKKE